MAASKSSASLDKWRGYFRTANSDIFDIIQQAIMVAATDCPKEFRIRRDVLAETLFSSKLTKCSGCERIELAVPCEDSEEFVGEDGDDECEGGISKGSKVNSCRDDQREMNVNNHNVSNYSYGEAEALDDEIEEEGQIVAEVLRIKEIVANSLDESDSSINESLRRLQLMDLSVETLKVTEIGKPVYALRRHASEEIRHLAKTLVEGWKNLVDEWVIATAAVTVSEATPESMNPSGLDEEEGLPSPPLDDLTFFTAQTTSMELSGFFEGMDDDGNPRNSGEFSKNREEGRRPPMENQSVPKWKEEQLPSETTILPKDKKGEQKEKQEGLIKKPLTPVKPNKPPVAQSGPGRPMKMNMEQKVHNGTKIVQQKSEKVTPLRRPLVSHQDKSRRSDEAAVQVKLEATKRKLQERYQQAENAKRQRTIQVMELHDLPKQGGVHKNPSMKPCNSHNRNRAGGRR